MLINKNKYEEIVKEVGNGVLVAVSKRKPVEAMMELISLGQYQFGENYVQEMVDKQQKLPVEIKWHFIGHLQTNKVKYIAPFVHLIHGVDTFKLLNEINKQGEKHQREIDVLLQIHIAKEETKFGLDETELYELIEKWHIAEMKYVNIKGLMGMASFTDDMEQVRKEFKSLKQLFDQLKLQQMSNFNFEILSMGMSADYKIALEEGSNMLRIGSLIFGERSL